MGLKVRLGSDGPLKRSNPKLFKTKIAHLVTLLNMLFYDLDSFRFAYIN